VSIDFYSGLLPQISEEVPLYLQELTKRLEEAFAVIDAKEVNHTTVTTTLYIAANEDIILVDDDAAGGVVTITLPATSRNNAIYNIKKLGTTANVVIDGNTAETIDGGLTATLTVQYESITIYSDGLNWHIL